MVNWTRHSTVESSQGGGQHCCRSDVATGLQASLGPSLPTLPNPDMICINPLLPHIPTLMRDLSYFSNKSTCMHCQC